jgi:hypothetical protein
MAVAAGYLGWTEVYSTQWKPKNVRLPIVYSPSLRPGKYDRLC